MCFCAPSPHAVTYGTSLEFPYEWGLGCPGSDGESGPLPPMSEWLKRSHVATVQLYCGCLRRSTQFHDSQPSPPCILCSSQHCCSMRRITCPLCIIDNSNL